MFSKIFALITAFILFTGAALCSAATLASEGGGGEDLNRVAPSTSTKRKAVRKPPTVRKKQPRRQTRKRPAVRKKATRKTTVRSKRRTRRATVRKTRRRAVRRVAPDTRRVASGLPPAGEARFLNDQVIVRYRRSAPARRLDALVARLGLRHQEARTFALAGVTAHLYTIANGTPVRAIITSLEASPDVLTAQPNYIYETQQAANSAASAQYALAKLNLPKGESRGGDAVRIAIIDSLIETSHPEFSTAVFNAHDLVEEADSETDDHGTSMAGVLASGGTLAGLAPRATIIAIRAFRRTEEGKTRSDSWTLGKALDLAYRQEARVLNLSFSGPADPLVRDSLKGAERRGIVSVAAAGNAGPDADPLYPAGYETTLAVTATGSDDAIYDKANRGAYISLAAPGVQILTSTANGGYGMKTGTSIATAHASGIVALALEAQPGIQPKHLMGLIRKTAVDLGDPGPDPIYGNGLVNASSLFEELQAESSASR